MLRDLPEIKGQIFYLTHCLVFFPPYLLLVWLDANNLLRPLDTSFLCLLTPFIPLAFYIFTVVVQVEEVGTDYFEEGPWKSNAKVDPQNFSMEYHVIGSNFSLLAMWTHSAM